MRAASNAAAGDAEEACSRQTVRLSPLLSAPGAQRAQLNLPYAGGYRSRHPARHV